MYLIANGGISDYPKNTKESVLLSKFDDSIDGVLIDVRLTFDNKLVLYENDLIVNNQYISRMNYEDIKKIDFNQGIKNYYIPLLEDILLYYDKDILIIKLHHNYDQNDKLINELNKVLNKYYVNRLIIVVDNDNLYDYLKLYTDYEIYNLNKINNFININVSSKNYNSKLVSNINSKNKNDLEKFRNLIKDANVLDNVFVLTNNALILKKYYL